MPSKHISKGGVLSEVDDREVGLNMVKLFYNTWRRKYSLEKGKFKCVTQ